MIGIYKITNKLNNKSYIGQSIHCGKRFDEHYKGAQLIDEIIQIEGIENFNFEILKEVNKEDLSYWEDYFIIKYNTMFPSGYNKKWNCNREIRNQIEQEIKADTSQQIINCKLIDIPQKIIEDNLKITIPIEEEYIVSNSMKLYMYLLSISKFNKQNKIRVFAHKDFSVNKIRQIIGMHPTTTKKYWQLLENCGLIKYEGPQHTNLDWDTNFKLRKKDIATYYSIPKRETYITISKEILNKMQNCEVSEQEIKIYLFLIKLQEQFDNINSDDKTFSFKDLRQLLQLRKETSNHKSILNSLAQLKTLGLINYDITENNDNNLKVKVPTFHLINVNF